MSLLAVAMYHYPTWHYTKALRGVYVIWMNYLWFFFNYFSIVLLVRTLFAPWKRLGETYRDAAGRFKFEKVPMALVVNTMMRLLGACIRLVVIVLGLLSMAFVCIFGVLLFFVWIAMPFVIVTLPVLGVFLIVN